MKFSKMKCRAFNVSKRKNTKAECNLSILLLKMFDKKRI